MTKDIKNTDFTGRLEYIIGQSGDSNKTFAKRCGISEKQIYVYLRGTSEPGMRFFTAMKAQYPWVDIDWLITGVKKAEPDPADTIIDIQHEEVIKKFSNKETARRINTNLLEIEKINPSALKTIDVHVNGVLEGLRLSVEPQNEKDSAEVGKTRVGE